MRGGERRYARAYRCTNELRERYDIRVGRAEELFASLCADGLATIDGMIAEHKSEQLWLDFKRATDDGDGQRLHENDRKNLAKAISGFGNSEGGVIVWGVDCRPHPDRGDVPHAKQPIRNPARFRSWLEGAVSGCTIPPHQGVMHHVIPLPGTDGGYVVTLVPKSDRAPHRSVNHEQYYLRAGSSFAPVPHDALAGMFGRRPQPTLACGLTSTGIARITHPKPMDGLQVHTTVTLKSNGPGIARDLYVNIGVQLPEHWDIYFLPVDETRWTEHQEYANTQQLLTHETFRLAPFGTLPVVTFGIKLLAPFPAPFLLRITYGHGTAPPQELRHEVCAEDLARIWGDANAALVDGAPTAALTKMLMGADMTVRPGSKQRMRVLAWPWIEF